LDFELVSWKPWAFKLVTKLWSCCLVGEGGRGAGGLVGEGGRWVGEAVAAALAASTDRKPAVVPAAAGEPAATTGLALLGETNCSGLALVGLGERRRRWSVRTAACLEGLAARGGGFTAARGSFTSSFSCAMSSSSSKSLNLLARLAMRARRPLWKSRSLIGLSWSRSGDRASTSRLYGDLVGDFSGDLVVSLKDLAGDLVGDLEDLAWSLPFL